MPSGEIIILPTLDDEDSPNEDVGVAGVVHPVIQASHAGKISCAPLLVHFDLSSDGRERALSSLLIPSDEPFERYGVTHATYTCKLCEHDIMECAGCGHLYPFCASAKSSRACSALIRKHIQVRQLVPPDPP